MHNKRLGRDDILKIEVSLLDPLLLQGLIMVSGREPLLLLPGDSIQAEIVSVLQAVVLLVVAVDLPLPDAAVGTTRHARMIAETEIVTVIMSDVTVEIALVALMTGKKMPTSIK